MVGAVTEPGGRLPESMPHHTTAPSNNHRAELTRAWRVSGDVSDQAKLCGCTSEFQPGPERMHRVVEAGAARIGLVLANRLGERWASKSDTAETEDTDEDIKPYVKSPARYRSLSVETHWVRAAPVSARERVLFALLSVFSGRHAVDVRPMRRGARL